MNSSIVVIKKTQFIKYIKLPVCANCSFFVAKQYRCAKFGEMNIITGKIAYVTADMARLTENMCGNNGRYFDQNLFTPKTI